jgi:DNA polymerase kappa
MLSTSNYIARRYGVRAAMPGFIAKKLCPNLKIVKPNFKEYTRVSHEVREILAEYDPKFAAASLDEAYLDLTDYLQERQQGIHHYRHRKPSSASTIVGKSNEIVDEGETNCCGDLTSNLMRDWKQMDCHREHSEESMNRLLNDCEREIDLLDWFDSETEEIVRGDIVETNSSINLTKSSNIVEHPHIEGTIPVDEPRKDKEPRDQVGQRFGDSVEDVVAEIRYRIFQRTALTASAGIAPNRMLAKVCSDRNKPNGQFYVKGDREKVIMFVRSLPIRKICGVGKVTAQMLNSIGITTCQQLYDQRDVLYLLFSPVSFQFFLDVSLGIGSSSVDSEYDRKSMSTERTFSEISRPSELYEKCLELCSDLAKDLQEEGLKGHTVTIKLKLVTFEVRQRAVSLSKATNDPEELFQAAVSSLQAEMKSCHPEPLRLRLMGVRVSNFEHLEKGQTTIMSLFENKHEGDEEEQKEATRFFCPVCVREQDFPVSSLASVNNHVDMCLSSQTASKQGTLIP